MQETEIIYAAGHELRDKILSKELSCVEVTQTFLKRIESLNSDINAYILILKEKALEKALDIDQNLEKYRNCPLMGIPISIKDLLFDIEDTVTTNGSLACKFRVAEHDSLCIHKLKDAGSVFLGKTNVPEFGTDYITKNYLMEPTSNPWKLTHSAGGSSGGAAASVAAGMAAVAIANDSAGSIRLPSSFCSLFGFMPSANLIPFSAEEEIMFRPLHRIGPISRCVKDSAILLDVIKHDSLKKDYFQSLLNKPSKPLKIGWSPDLGFGIRNQEITNLIQKRLIELQKMGYEVEEIHESFELLEHLADLKNFIYAKFRQLSDKVPLLIRPILSTSFNHILNEASEITNEDYEHALGFQKHFRKKMNSVMETYDLIITPTAASTSFPIKDYPSCIKKVHSDPFVFFASLLFPFNFSGQPAASLPCGFSKTGLPVGMQVIGEENKDDVIFQFCSDYEKAFPWQNKHPDL